jgi:hypothetical protein
MATDAPQEPLFCAAFLCDSVRKGPDGGVADILGVGPDVVITPSLPVTIDRTIVGIVVGPIGEHVLQCVLKTPDGERTYMGKLTVRMGGPPAGMEGSGAPIGRGYTTAPFNIILHSEGQHFLDIALDGKFLVHRIPILVRLESLAAGVH